MAEPAPTQASYGPPGQTARVTIDLPTRAKLIVMGGGAHSGCS